MIQIEHLNDPYQAVIALCWVVFFIVWAVSAWFVKRTVERSLGWARLLAFAFIVTLFGALSRVPGVHEPTWPRTAPLGMLADLITLSGLVVAVWARAVLGRNWSGSITFKEGHELIQRGPYAFVRHPIYSGLLLMGLGTAIASGRARTLLMLAGVLVVLAVKAHFEEELMMRHFPEAYPEYRRRVKALIPGVW
jgi:protein-S-isoprenylcysteine O-methyltransferase Ste14